MPKDLDEAVTWVENTAPFEALVAIYENSPFVHHSIGRYVRNTLGLWQEGSPLKTWFESKGFTHPDDMSSVIFDAVRAKKTGEPFDLQDRAACRWWAGVSQTWS